MTQQLPQCENLQDAVNDLLQLLQQEPKLRSQQDTTSIEASLSKAISPKFEIVFAGAFSAGKSMLINALLERELLYSAEGHATGTECYIEYADLDQERVVLTFLSVVEIQQQAIALCRELSLQTDANLNKKEVTDLLSQGCQAIIQQEGGEGKSERAKRAKALLLLIEGFLSNRDRVQVNSNATYSMEQFNFSNLSEAAGYARRGSNSAVLKRLEYYCNHPLLEDGNVLVDMPGIDAPVQKDAELTYRKIEHPDTSAVICVLKPASAGDMTSEETSLMEKMKSNLGIRDRVFYVFNRIDQTWYNGQLRQRLDNLIQSQFRDSTRVYKTSGLLGFYGSQIQQDTNEGDRFGLDSIFAENVKSLGGEEETPQFVSEFNNYCTSGKLTSTPFKVSVHGYQSPNENYVRILQEWGNPLIQQLINDSGIEEFRNAITRYLTEEKRPQLYANLADDLRPLCINLRKSYLETSRDLESQPHEIDDMKARELEKLNQQLQDIGEEFRQYFAEEVNAVVINTDQAFDDDFQVMKARMVSRLDELLQTFSVSKAYSRATLSHPRNATAPLIAVLVEALYYLANELEDVLVEHCQIVVTNFCQRFLQRLQSTDHYRKLYRLLNNDGGIEVKIQELEKQLSHALVSQAKTECDRYVRESPRFYDEGTFSIYQFRQTLEQTSRGYDAETILEAEPAIRQLLKLDFEPKVSASIRRNFRQTINQTIKSHVLPLAEHHADDILQKYDQARANLAKTLQKEAEEKINANKELQNEVDANIETYNQAVKGINNCLQAMQLYEHQLPNIGRSELVAVASDVEDSQVDFEEEQKV